MCTLDRPLWGVVETRGIVFDPFGGIGATRRRGGGRAAEAAELMVAMRPAVFLALAARLPTPRPSLAWITARLAAGCAVSPPWLRVWVPGDAAGVPAVLAHDGRHRATALFALLGEAEIPVRLDLANISPDECPPRWIVPALRRGMRAQGGARTIVPGPLFGAAETGWDDPLDVGHRERARAPPKFPTRPSFLVPQGIARYPSVSTARRKHFPSCRPTYRRRPSLPRSPLFRRAATTGKRRARSS
jgi:hypothetical protein